MKEEMLETKSRVPVRFVLLAVLTLALSAAYALKCPKCNADNRDGARYCRKCGEELSRPVEVARVTVPSVLGKDRDDAVRDLKDKGFRVAVEKTQSDLAPGKVRSQSPEPGVKAKKGATVTIYISAPAGGTRWLKSLVNYQGWPKEGERVAGITIGDSVSAVLDSLGKPSLQTERMLGYWSGADTLRVACVDGVAETLTVYMSEATSSALTTVLNHIASRLLGKLPEQSEGPDKAYPDIGITFHYRDEMIVGFSIYRPRTEARWVVALRKNWRGLGALAPANLTGVGRDSIRTLYGPPWSDEENRMVYEDRGRSLVFCFEEDEIDSTILSSGALLESLPLPKRRLDAERVFGRAARFRNLGTAGEEWIYPDSGLALVFDRDVLSSVRMYLPEYRDMVLVPSGNFLLGTSKRDVAALVRDHPEWAQISFSDEMPQQKIYLSSFYIDKYEVSNRQFERFVKVTGYKVEGEWRMITGRENHPAVAVTWNDARAYARWAGKRLPTEIEWEKAARCSLGNTYPWGSFDAPARANYRYSARDTGLGRTAPVDSFNAGVSAYGAYNMAGNAMEWCSNPYDAAYYKTIQRMRLTENPQGTENVPSDTIAAVRGGSFNSNLFGIRCAYRFGLPKRQCWWNLGFRCVKDAR